MEEARNGGRIFEKGWFFPALLALILVPLYIYCLPPGLPPYRDSGEMACAAWTLGIAHQPGYPLYIIGAKLFSLLPLGNPAWRFNLFSALAGLAALGVFWRLASRVFSPSSAFFAALLLGLNFTLRTVSSVPEMYALNFLFATLLLAAALTPDEVPGRAPVYLAAFLLGLGMTNRMDLLLAAPAVLILLWPRMKAQWPGILLRSTGFFFLGFSLYFYLLVRSGGDPLFDWSHPAELKTFLAVITRKSYGSTLDLISKNYAAGEMFLSNLEYYAVHLWENFSLALAACAAGIVAEWKTGRRRFFAVAALFFVSGPVFLFMANMPPNPHALAIVEPYYLFPDLAVAFWTAAGLLYLSSFSRAAACGTVLAAAAAAGLVFQNGAHGSFRRDLFAAEDYACDVMLSAPEGASIAVKKDVQLFSLWYMQAVKGMRPDLKIIAQGLSGSPWYRASSRRRNPDLALFNLNSPDAAEWAAFSAANPGGFYATPDAEVPRSVPSRPAGLLKELYPGKSAPGPASPLYYSPGRLGLDYRDFFDRDLGTSYALAFTAGAAGQAGVPGASWMAGLRLARLLDPDMPEVPLYEGFYYSSRGEWNKAAAGFRESADIYERLLGLAEQYRSLPAVREGLLASGAYAWLNYGVALEKTGDRDGSERAYLAAQARNPGLAEAHYNLAILYWNRDWARVKSELAETVRLNPAHAQAAKYLSQIEKR